jgi:redox-sensitive bicupin YhaK (pirin superfamily)
MHFDLKDIPKEYQGFVYVLSGNGIFGDDSKGEAHMMLVLSELGDYLPISATSEALRFVVIAGKPLGEPVVQYGPFVMNHSLEISQAMNDYHHFTNGFENARNWTSSISNWSHQ